MSDSTNNNKVNGHIMSLQQLISAPLVATIDADAMSTERYMKHFMSLAFESYNPVDGSTGALRLISFNFTDSDASGGAGKKVSVNENVGNCRCRCCKSNRRILILTSISLTP